MCSHFSLNKMLTSVALNCFKRLTFHFIALAGFQQALTQKMNLLIGLSGIFTVIAAENEEA